MAETAGPGVSQVSAPGLPPSSGQRHPVYVFCVITFLPSSFCGCSVLLGSPLLLGVMVRHLRPGGDPRPAWPRACPGQRTPLRRPGSKAPPLGHLLQALIFVSPASRVSLGRDPSARGTPCPLCVFAWEQGAPALRLCPSGSSPLPAVPPVSGHLSCPSFPLTPGVSPGTVPGFQPAAPPPSGSRVGGGPPRTWGPDGEWGCRHGFGVHQVIRRQQTVTVTLGKLSNHLVPQFPHL